MDAGVAAKYQESVRARAWLSVARLGIQGWRRSPFAALFAAASPSLFILCIIMDVPPLPDMRLRPGLAVATMRWAGCSHPFLQCTTGLCAALIGVSRVTVARFPSFRPCPRAPASFSLCLTLAGAGTRRQGGCGPACRELHREALERNGVHQVPPRHREEHVRTTFYQWPLLNH